MNQHQPASSCESHVCADTYANTLLCVRTHTHTPASATVSLRLITHPLKPRRIFHTCGGRRRCPRHPRIGGKGCRGDRISVSFSPFKCHEDGAVLIWQQTWINNFCHFPSSPLLFCPCPPTRPFKLCHLYVRTPPSVCCTVAPNPCWNLITTALFNWNGIDEWEERGWLGRGGTVSFEASLLLFFSFLSHSLSLLYPCEAQMVSFFFFIIVSADFLLLWWIDFKEALRLF